MEFVGASGFFDTQPVLDAYSGSLLFYGQPDTYNASTRDSETGWRRVLSAQDATLPLRGCVLLGADRFVVGRTVSDFFQGEIVRENLLLHPADYLVDVATSAGFLSSPVLKSQMYAGVSWLKERKDESLSSDTLAMYDVYCAGYEAIARGMVLKLPGGSYLRVAGVDLRSGGLLVLATYDLDTNPLRSVVYTPSTGVYQVTTDAYITGTPVTIPAFIESYRSNYHFQNSSAEKFERADKIVTIKNTAVSSPKPEDTLVDSGVTLRVLDCQSDGLGSWELHTRPV